MDTRALFSFTFNYCWCWFIVEYLQYQPMSSELVIPAMLFMLWQPSCCLHQFLCCMIGWFCHRPPRILTVADSGTPAADHLRCLLTYCGRIIALESKFDARNPSVVVCFLLLFFVVDDWNATHHHHPWIYRHLFAVPSRWCRLLRWPGLNC